MFPNAKVSELVAVAAVINPASLATGNTDSAWISMAQFQRLMAVVTTGVLGASATLDISFRQATDSSGTGAKAVTGKAATQIVKATGDNKQVLVNLAGQELDVEGGFSFVSLRLAVGTAASIAGAVVLGSQTRYGDAETLDIATVVQIVP